MIMFDVYLKENIWYWIIPCYFAKWGKFAGIYTDGLNQDHVIDKQHLISTFKSKFDAQLKSINQEISDPEISQRRFQGTGSGKWPTSWSQQFFVLLRRDVKERKYEAFSALRISQVLVVALMSGLLWYKSDISHLQDQVRISTKLIFMGNSVIDKIMFFQHVSIFSSLVTCTYPPCALILAHKSSWRTMPL